VARANRRRRLCGVKRLPAGAGCSWREAIDPEGFERAGKGWGKQFGGVSTQMEEHMRKKSILALVGMLAFVATLVVGPGASAQTAKPTRASAGTVVIVHDQEPGDTLNVFLAAGNGYTVALAVNPILANGAVYNQNATLVPYLLTSLPKLVKKEPLKVTLTYKANAVWSDGRQITGNDLRATWRTIMNKNWDIVSRAGWEDIAGMAVKGKTVTVTFKKGRAYAAWDALLSASPLPAHKIAGKDFNKLWATSMDISSGPFRFGSWQKGTQLTLLKNTSFKIRPAKLDRIVFRYIAGASQFQALKSGEGDLVEPQPQTDIVPFYSDKKFKVQAGASYQWEHIDFQQGPKAHPALKKKYIRQAIITGINRGQIRSVLYFKTGLIKNQKLLPVLQSNIWKPFERFYRMPYSKYGFKQAKVISSLKAHGCTGGPSAPKAGNNDIWTCPGVGKLSFEFTTTSGNPLRALTFEIIQQQLKSVGIELKPRFLSPAVLFGGGTLTSGDWQMVMFTFISDPTGPATYADIQGCGGDQNYHQSCDKKASALLNKAKFTADPVARADLLNRAEVLLADDVFSIPLFSRPAFLLNAARVKGPILNPTQQGSTWNAETWSKTS
jgi:peptide/nickel transport system substrate-binding protein